MLGKMQYRKEKHFQSLTSSSQPIALQKVQIKKITVMLGHDCLKTLRKISKALFKVNLEDRAMMENGTQWNIIFLKTTHTHTSDNVIFLKPSKDFHHAWSKIPTLSWAGLMEPYVI